MLFRSYSSSNGTAELSYTEYTYNASGAAFDTDSNTLDYTTTYRSSTSRVKVSETFYDTRLGQGFEISNYSLNYKSDGSGVKNTTVFFYGSLNSRTSDKDKDGKYIVNEDTQMASSATYDGDRSTDLSTISFDTTTARESVTYYAGGVKQEVAKYTINYDKTDGTTVKDTSEIRRAHV